MLKSIVKKIAIIDAQPTHCPQPYSTRKGQFPTKGWKPTSSVLWVALSSVAAILTVCQSAFAQLNVGQNGVQRGLEQEYLQYQISGQDLSQMRGISGCTVGFGLGCNKTGSVLNQLLESNNRATYQDLLIRAAGGPENFRNFAAFYGNNPNLSQVPYASFWQNDSPSIMDGYRYVLGSPVSSSPVEGLGLVTKNFYWAPLSGADDSLSLRSGLLDLKYSYGRALLEEVSKIPNVEQQIQSMGLSPEMTKFYTRNLSRGLQALNAGDEKQIEHSILNILSSPYSPEGGEFQRPSVGIPKVFDNLYGEGLPGDQFVATQPVFLSPEVGSLDLPESVGELGGLDLPESVAEFVPAGGAGAGFPLLAVLGGAGALAGLALLLVGGGGGKSSPGPVALVPNGGGSTPTPTPTDTPTPTPTPTPGGGGSTPTPTPTPTPIISIPPGGSGGGEVITPPDTTKVPEASAVKALVLMIIVFWMLSNKHRRIQTRV